MALRDRVADLDGIIVYDNGSDVPYVPPFADPRITVIRGQTNQGAGAGVTALMRAVLDCEPTSILYVEDDFLCRQSFSLSACDAFVADRTVGRIALAERPARPKAKYYTFTLVGQLADEAAAQVDAPLQPAPGLGEYQRIRVAWSNYPCVISPTVAQKYLTHNWTETQVARAFYLDGLQTLSVVPGFFIQTRAGHRERNVPGWSY